MSRVCVLEIIDVIRTSDGVSDGHDEPIVNEQDSDVHYQESLGNSGTRPMCSSGGTEFSPLKVPELMQTYCPSMHVLSSGSAKLSL